MLVQSKFPDSFLIQSSRDNLWSLWLRDLVLTAEKFLSLCLSQIDYLSVQTSLITGWNIIQWLLPAKAARNKIFDDAASPAKSNTASSRNISLGCWTSNNELKLVIKNHTIKFCTYHFVRELFKTVNVNVKRSKIGQLTWSEDHAIEFNCWIIQKTADFNTQMKLAPSNDPL